MQKNSAGRGRHTGIVAATAIAMAAALLAAGCGGGSDGSPGNPGTPASASLTGTAATGSALANANVAVTDSAGTSPCVETAITTTALGAYTCTLKAGETAPFFVVVTDPTGNTAPLVSVTTVTPPAGSPLTLNATPLTTAIVAQLSPDGNPLTLVNSKTVDATALKTLTANVVAQLSAVLNAIGAPADYDPFVTSISAATAIGVGNTADQVLDIVKVTKDPSTGQLQLSTIENPTPVPLATPSSGGSTVPAPTANVSSLAQGVQAVASALTACFAQPPAQRAVATDPAVPAYSGGPTVTALGAACQNITSDTGNAGGVAFLHNGYKAGQWLYGALTSSTMTGAQFSVPEIVMFFRAANTASGQDEAVINIRYLDADGNPGNLITLARSIAGGASNAHPSTWWLVGNGQPVDVSDRLQVRRVEQLNPNFSASNNNYSHFQTGIQFQVNAKGPGSVNANGNLSYARVTGPGLPTNGLVYIAPDSVNEPNQNYMDVSTKTGAIGGGRRCQPLPPPPPPPPAPPFPPPAPTYNCPNFWVARTVGLTGTDATTPAAVPGGVDNPVWSQQGDGSDASLFKKGEKYTIELFYGTQTTPDHTYQKTLLTDLVQVGQIVNLPWNTPGSQTLAELDPANSSTNGVQSTVTLDWVQNPSAQQIGSGSITVDTHGSYSATTFVPRGATSVVITLPQSQQVPALTTSGTRSALFGYRMLDNTAKSAVFTYN